jgi:ubiquinone biosynthesis protein COQ9
VTASLDPVRAALLDEMLRHVVFDGWSPRALAAAAEAKGIDGATLRRAFPRGVADAVAYFSDWADRRMLAAMEGQGGAEGRRRDRVALAVRARLEALAPHREACRRLIAWFALPGHQPLAGRCLWRTVDSIWRAAGDRAADFGYYTKRALLAGVYGATLLVWLDDRSEGSAESWAFLERRIAEAMRIPSLRGRATEFVRNMAPRARPAARH